MQVGVPRSNLLSSFRVFPLCRAPKARRASRRGNARTAGQEPCSGPARAWDPYLAYSTALSSRTTVIRICPGYWRSSSTCLAMSRARTCAGAAPRDLVGHLGQDGLDGPLLHLAVV